MKRNRNVKIIATIGPASASPEFLEKLYLSGVDVFRLNFSHGLREDHEKVYGAIRLIGRRYHAFPTIIADLQGPKLRIGAFDNSKVTLRSGDIFRLDADHELGNQERVHFPHSEIFEAMQVGTRVLLDDGKLELEVVSSNCDGVETKVIVGGTLSDRKGVNIPNMRLPIPILTQKDLRDLTFALELGVDWVVLSFVQTVEDVEKARDIIKGRAAIISKIEKPSAVEHLDPIVEASDAIMVARGDLGVEINQEEIPSIQRNILKTCHRLGRPVIVATHMMESMTNSPVPTRAEVSDVSNAVYQLTDATMLSAESASGRYPLEAVEMMKKIIEKTESDPSRVRHMEDESLKPHKTVVDAICAAAKEATEYSGAVAIVLFANSLETVVRCSRLRPLVPIVFITDCFELASRAGLCCGVYSVVARKELDADQMCRVAKSVITEQKFATVGDNIVIANVSTDTSVTICKV
ncbi:MAG: pyruvate kinase [Holosporaceae bacterium]|jgi:pyruvate kinase|nr:pyruvate kinase [Holosporaceae bacterium]